MLPIRRFLLAIATTTTLAMPMAAIAQAIRSTDRVLFSARGQSLWGPRDGIERKEFDYKFFHEGEQGADGEIRRVDVDVDVDNSQACAVWEDVVEECMATSRYGVSPSRSQCINGFSVSYPCPTFSDPFKICTQSYPGIGPKPAGSISRPFDVGATVEWDINYEFGLRGELAVDEGSVDVDYASDIEISVDEDAAAAGEVFTLRVRELPGAASELRSRWPSVSAGIFTYADAHTRIDVHAAGPDTTTGEQLDVRESLYSGDSDGLFDIELGGFTVGAAGLELRILEEPAIRVDGGVEFNVALPVAMIPGTVPIDIGLNLFDVGLFTPDLDTPVTVGPGGFDGFFENGVYAGGAITNSIDPGERDFFESSIEDFDWHDVRGGITAPDVARFDVDLDTMLIPAFGTPLGIKASIYPIVPGVLSLLTVEGNAIDADVAFFFSFKESLTFEPRLRVTLRFSKPARVETAPSSGEFEWAESRTIAVGDALSIIHPGGGFSVTPEYSIDENRFFNDTDFTVLPVFQATALELKLGGLVMTVAGGLPGSLPDRFVAAQWTLPLDGTVKLADLNWLDDSSVAEFGLDFSASAQAGRPLAIHASGALFRRGDANASGVVDLSDAVSVLGALFLGSAAPTCDDAADSNDDGRIDLSDAVSVLGALFLGSAEPPAPGMLDCGTDPTDDVLECAGHEPCA